MQNLTPAQLQQFSTDLGQFHRSFPEFQSLPTAVKALQTETATINDQLAKLRSLIANRPQSTARPRQPGTVSDELAGHIAAQFIAQCEKSGRLEALSSTSTQREALTTFARNTLDLSTRAALTTNDVPLPQQYGREFRELISEFGVVRAHMTHYPIGMGIARPPRMGARELFGSIVMSAPIPDKAVSLTLASLESHKVGGIVRLPREIDEQSAVPIGQFIARYGAVEFARAEDRWGFLADGQAAFENVTGIVQVARDNGKTVTLAAGKTKPSDATLDDFRLLRTKVNKAALNGRRSAYFLDSTWETKLPSFRTPAEPHVYDRRPDGTAVLDGYPIIWTDVLEPYGVAAAPDKPLAVFGAIEFWWFAEHGAPRMDTSDHVLFINDQLAVRFIEEIDFDYSALDAMAALLTAAP